MTKLLGLLDLIPGWAYALLIAGMTVILTIVMIDGAAAKTKYANLRATTAEAQAKAQKEARERERNLQNGAATLRKQKDEEITRIGGELAASEQRLRDSRDGRVPGAATTGVVGSGACVSSAYGVMALREAARADRVVAELNECRARYEEVRKK